MSNDPATDSMTKAVTVAVMDAIQTRDRELSEKLRQAQADEASLDRTARNFTNAKEIVIAVGFFITLIGGASIAWAQLEDKPTKVEMGTAIDAKVDPVIKVVETTQKDVGEMKTDITRMKDVQAIQLEHDDWRVKVADCRADRSCKKPPDEPETLKDKKRELLAK